MAIPTIKPSALSVVQAGWILLVAGACTFWIYGVGFLFFLAGIVLAVVAMVTRKVKAGLWLLVSTLATMTVCGLMFFFLVLGAVGGALRRVATGTDSAKPKLPVVIPFEKRVVAPASIRFPEPDDIRIVSETAPGKLSPQLP